LDLGKPKSAHAVEVGDHAVVEHLAVHAAGRLPEAAGRATGVVLDPVARVVAEAHLRQIDEFPTIRVGLGSALGAARVVER
jgi:hypothetical protein